MSRYNRVIPETGGQRKVELIPTLHKSLTQKRYANDNNRRRCG